MSLKDAPSRRARVGEHAGVPAITPQRLTRSPVTAGVDGPSPPPRRRLRAMRSTRLPWSDGLPGVPDLVSLGMGATREALELLIVGARADGKTRRRLAVADVSAIAPEYFGPDIPSLDECIDGYGWRWIVHAPLTLGVTHLARPIGDGVTKGDLLRYYVSVAPYLLRALAGRPLVLRRHTDAGQGAFYQQHVNSAPPPGVGTAIVEGDPKPRFVGGSLVTLLYLAQLGAISMDPWHGRADAPELVDYTIVDLDPGPDARFSRVVDVARWVHDELLTLGLASLPKTSGASGMHVVVPLPSDTTADVARTIAEVVATQVAARHRHVATVVRSVRGRAADAVYVDYLQNIPGKTVASVYAARATPALTVSTPLDWTEVTPALDPRDWTIRSVPARLASVGDLWADAMQRGNDLEALRRVAHGAVGRRVPNTGRR